MSIESTRCQEAPHSDKFFPKEPQSPSFAHVRALWCIQGDTGIPDGVVKACLGQAVRDQDRLRTFFNEWGDGCKRNNLPAWFQQAVTMIGGSYGEEVEAGVLGGRRRLINTALSEWENVMRDAHARMGSSLERFFIGS